MGAWATSGNQAKIPGVVGLSSGKSLKANDNLMNMFIIQ